MQPNPQPKEKIVGVKVYRQKVDHSNWDVSFAWWSRNNINIVKQMIKLTLKSNWMSMYFPKRLELSFRKVFAFPKAWEKSYSKEICEGKIIKITIQYGIQKNNLCNVRKYDYTHTPLDLHTLLVYREAPHLQNIWQNGSLHCFRWPSHF